MCWRSTRRVCLFSSAARMGCIVHLIFFASDATGGEQFERADVAIGEGAAELVGDEEAVGEIAEPAEGWFVFDFVAEQGSGA
jgi:hypothetical protein